MRSKPEPACTIPILFVFLDIYASCTPNAPLQATSQRRKTIDNHNAKTFEISKKLTKPSLF